MARAAHGDSRIGTVLQGRYRITDELSRGGMGVVFRGEQVALGRSVAIKFLHAAYSNHADFVERFEREAKLTSRLEHPNVVSVIDFGVDGSPYIVMDFVAGQTLQDLLIDGALEPRRAIDIVRQILAGLAHAHGRGIIHRDVKPANVMLTKATAAGDHVQLLDFGLAKLLDVDQTSASTVLGTPTYMSPEQASGKKADERTDVYSCGLVLFELLTGTKVFQGEGALALMRMHADEIPDRLAARKPDGAFSSELEEVVKRSLAKRCDERFQTPGEMLEAIGNVPETTGRASEPVASEAPPRQRRSLGRAKWLVIPVVALGAWWLAGKPGIEEVSVNRDLAFQSGSDSSSSGEEQTNAEREAKIKSLHAQLREKPGSSPVLYKLGNLYFDKGWAAEGLAAYQGALKKNKKLATRQTLNDNAIEALGDAKTRVKARTLIVKSIGPSAIPFLRAAAKSKPTLRSEIKELISRLE